MSQKETKIQGMESAEVPNSSPFSANPSFYTRSSQSSKGTYVAGLNPLVDGNANSNQLPHQPSPSQVPTGKPIVGFLYSISRTAFGEYWPLHVGQNKIGKSPTCDVILPEGTVSNEHASIVVRKLKNPIKLIASIRDSSSTNGTMRNGESLGFSAVDCFDGDIITIGDNYELLLILIDTEKLKLSVSTDFIPVPEETEMPIDFPFENNYVPKDGTVGFDGRGISTHGETKGL